MENSIFRKLTDVFAQKNDQNTKFTTNDRTRNTKFILDHVFKWILREKVIFSQKNLRNQERCSRSRKE